MHHDQPSGATQDEQPVEGGGGVRAANRPGESIGPYRLLECIGEGGFGVVWLADQTEPVRRRVAIKVIKPGMDSREVVARFQAERQALAVMNHPNVAKVFDAGTTSIAAGSRPYFVMEHVKGSPITEYCDRERLTVAQRLRLFTRVCDAVHHAHMKGIIHRDLKPSNILVTISESGEPRPVVIDFGVAKALTGSLSAHAIHTERGVLIGTPEYMSPEQAEMSETDVDTRTDVYALGVVLYELLTGTLPFDSASLRAAGYAAIQRVIREQDPPRPSAQVSTMGERLDRVAAARHARPADLASTLRRELEWIPLKAMRKDRSERYRSASELADDVENYLASRPLIAGPEGTAYRLRKFARRNRVPVVAGAVVAAALLAAAGVSIRFGLREAAARAEADEQRAGAVAAAERATAIKEYLVNVLQSSDPGESGTQGMLVSDAIRRGVEQIHAGSLSDQPATRAALLSASAQIFRSNGRLDEAAPLAEEALSIVRGLHPGDHADVAMAMADLGFIRENIGRAAEAEPLLEGAMAMQQRLAIGDSPEVVTVLCNLAYVRDSLGRTAEAEPLYERAAAIQERLYKGDHPERAKCLNNLAFVRDSLGRTAEAEVLYRQVLEMQRRIHKGDHPDIAITLGNLAAARHASGQLDEAEALYVQALEMHTRLFKGDHPVIATDLNNVAAIRESLGRAAEAEPLFRRALEMRQRLYSGDHPEIAASLHNLAFVMKALGRFSESEALYVQALDMYRRLFRGDHAEVANCLTNLAAVMLDLARAPEARLKADEATEMFRRLFPVGHPLLAKALMRSGSARLAQGNAREALPLLEESVTIAEKMLPPEHRQLREAREALAACRAAAQ